RGGIESLRLSLTQGTGDPLGEFAVGVADISLGHKSNEVFKCLFILPPDCRMNWPSGMDLEHIHELGAARLPRLLAAGNFREDLTAHDVESMNKEQAADHRQIAQMIAAGDCQFPEFLLRLGTAGSKADGLDFHGIFSRQQAEHLRVPFNLLWLKRLLVGG